MRLAVLALLVCSAQGSYIPTQAGAVPSSSLPNPSASTLGGIQSFAGSANNFMTSISTSGVPAGARPSCSSLSDAGAGCTGAAGGTGGGLVSLHTVTGSINATETQVVSASIAANTMNVGTVYRVRACGKGTESATGNNIALNVRIGANNNNTDTIIANYAGANDATGSNIAWCSELLVTIQTTGAGGTAWGSSFYVQHGLTGANNTNADAARDNSAQTVNTTITNHIQLTCTGAATLTIVVEQAVVELVNQ